MPRDWHFLSNRRPEDYFLKTGTDLHIFRFDFKAGAFRFVFDQGREITIRVAFTDQALDDLAGLRGEGKRNIQLPRGA